MKLHDGRSLFFLQFGVLPDPELQFVTIELSPEELLDFWKEYGAVETRKQLGYLLRYYNPND